MHRRVRYEIGLLFVISNLLVTTGAWFGAYFLRYATWTTRALMGDGPDPLVVIQTLPIVLVLSLIIYRLCGLNEVHRMPELAEEVVAVFRASGLLFLMVITVTFYKHDLEIYTSRAALGIFLVLNAGGLTVVRRLVWGLLRHQYGHGFARGRALIVGAGRPGRRVAQTIQNQDWLGLDVVGFVDHPGKVEPSFRPRLGDIGELEAIVKQYRIGQVIVALPLSRCAELPAIYQTLSDLLVGVQFVPDIPSLAGMRIRPVEIDNVAFISLRENPHSGWHRIAKRALDLALGSVALLLLAPWMLLLALLVKLTSPGPVLFRQPRTGLGGRTFDMLKFRSMKVDAGGGLWTVRNDDRCTTVGRFLRRWSLDELPQLLNVLKGDMSLVGPRPESSSLVEKFSRQIPNYTQRHQVKVGITGWAQVNGWRGNTSLRKRVECDLFYVCNWTLALDLKILWMTVWRGFRHRNAY
ncbi:MAG: undecaprenyl-phosphate glucose phosphotransferase [Pirellulales bacterium]